MKTIFAMLYWNKVLKLNGRWCYVTSCRNNLLVIGNWHNRYRINTFCFFYSNLNDVAQNTAVTSCIIHYQKIKRNIFFTNLLLPPWYFTTNYNMENNKSRLINNTRNVIPVLVGHLNKTHYYTYTHRNLYSYVYLTKRF